MSILIGVNMNALTKQQVQTISEKIERDKGFINQLKASPQEALKAIDIEVDSDFSIELVDSDEVDLDKVVGGGYFTFFTGNMYVSYNPNSNQISFTSDGWGARGGNG